MSDIFLSYLREDGAKAKTIAEVLERQGLSVWLDRVIPVGRTFDEVIQEELNSAKCVIVLWSHNSVSSEWVAEEAVVGKKRGILVPVLIDNNTEIPHDFRHIQAADLTEWSGDLHSPEFSRLLEAIEEKISKNLVKNESKDIFLGYNNEDRPRAKVIAEALKDNGYSVWWDKLIPPGKPYETVIEEAIDAAKCMIVLWSHTSVSSDWVKQEAHVGKKRGILFPILIDEVEIPFGFGRIQAARLVDWKGTLPNPEFDFLLESIRKIIGVQAEKKKPKAREKVTNKKYEVVTSNVHKTDDTTGFFFISYSRDDKEIVDKVIERLKETNRKVWIDTGGGITGGILWRKKIVEAIIGSIAFIIVLSPNSIKSENVRKELDIADTKRKKIIPINIESITIPPEFEYPLAGLQSIDFASDFEFGITQLVAALQTPQ